MRQKKEEITYIERLLLKSMAFDTVCPNCGRAVHIAPKDLIWQFGCVHHDADGKTIKEIPSGFLYRCKCEKDIPVAISIGIDDDRKTEE